MCDVAEGRTTENPGVLRGLWGEGRDRIQGVLRKNSEMAGLVKRLLAIHIHDWIWPLGNVLSRAFEGERGGALRSALLQRSFLGDLGRRGATLDGLSIAEWVFTDGKLLRLADGIDKFSDEFSSAHDMGESYVKTVFGIPGALLVLHDAILRRGGTDDPVSPPPTSGGLF